MFLLFFLRKANRFVYSQKWVSKGKHLSTEKIKLWKRRWEWLEASKGRWMSSTSFLSLLHHQVLKTASASLIYKSLLSDASGFRKSVSRWLGGIYVWVGSQRFGPWLEMRWLDTLDLIPMLEKRTKRFSYRQNSEENFSSVQWVAKGRLCWNNSLV